MMRCRLNISSCRLLCCINKKHRTLLNFILLNWMMLLQYLHILEALLQIFRIILHIIANFALTIILLELTDDDISQMIIHLHFLEVLLALLLLALLLITCLVDFV